MKNYLFILIIIQIFYLNCDDDCFDYDYNCLICNIKNNKEYFCQECSRGYNLINGECVEDTSCDDPDCEICKNKIRCKTCKNGKELNNGFCIDQKNGKKGNKSTGLIIGIIFMLIAIFIIIGIIIYCCFCKKNKNYNNNNKGTSNAVVNNRPYYKDNNNSNQFRGNTNNNLDRKNVNYRNNNNISSKNTNYSPKNKNINNNLNNRVNNHPNNNSNSNIDKKYVKDMQSPGHYDSEFHRKNVLSSNSGTSSLNDIISKAKSEDKDNMENNEDISFDYGIENF